MHKKTKAFFVEYPFRIEDLKRPFLASQAKSFIIETTVELAKIDWGNFSTDLCVDRWFIEYNTHLCKVDDVGVWHCIFVHQKGRTDGILVMSEGRVFAKWAAYYKA